MNKFKKARLECELTQWELSLITGIGRYLIQLIEAGHKKPNQKQASELAKVLKISEIELWPEM